MGAGTSVVLSLATIAGALLFTGSGPSLPAVAEEVVWINELETDAQWIGKEVVVEGRFRGRVGQNREQIQLQNSKVEFQLSDELAQKATPGRGFVRLSGRLTKSNGKLVMRVTSLTKITTTDAERYQAAADKIIEATDHRSWESLAERTERLAEFYNNDKELIALASAARVRGFRARERSLRTNQVEELLALADTVKEVGLDESGARRMRHKALRWQFDSLAARSAAADDWHQFVDRIARLLPGARIATKPVHEPTLARYRDGKPIDVYDADVAMRDAFDRELWSSATSRWLMAEAAKPRPDLFDVAARAKALLPERLELWRMLLKQAVDIETRKLSAPSTSQVSTSQVKKLAGILRDDLGEPAQADALIRRWLGMQRNKLGKEDAERRCELARAYRNELKDDKTATELLLEAVAIVPDLPQAVEELKSLGIVKGSGGWGKGATDLEPAKSGAAGRKLPETDMTPDEVREKLGAPRPEDIVRLGTKDQLLEQWLYRGPPDIYVTFRKSGTFPPRVVKVTTRPPK